MGWRKWGGYQRPRPRARGGPHAGGAARARAAAGRRRRSSTGAADCRGARPAHQKGIIHRDLKPSKIASQSSTETGDEGTVKVLDFGLAKAIVGVGAAHLANPTFTSPALMTGQGVILGTAAAHESRASEGTRGGQAQ